MAWVAIAASVISAVGALQQGQAAKQAANYNAAVAERNAVVARQQGAANEEANRRNASRILGRMRAGYGASGVTPEGSPLDVLEDSVADAEMDALNTRYASELKALGYTSEAELQRYSGKQAQTSSYFRAAGALLGAPAKRVDALGNPVDPAGDPFGIGKPVRG